MKSEFNFKMIYADGRNIDMHEDKNLWISKFRIQPPKFSRKMEKVDGRYGLVEVETSIDTRFINVLIQVEGFDVVDFDMLRDEIFLLFNPFDEFYLVRDIQPNKRYKVKVANLSGLDFDDGSLEDGQFEVQFEMLQPFAESLAVTGDTKEWDADKWAWGMGIEWDEDLKYSFTSNTFNVKNLGDVALDPCQHDLEIIIKATASSYLQITNNTTGEVYRYNGALTASDTLVLRGVQSFKNGISIFGNTNKKLLTLSVGNNSFTVTGGTIISAAFNFRFLYM